MIHNKGNQCYATTVLHYLLSNPDFRKEISLKLKSPKDLLAIYLSKLHLVENVGEDYLLKLSGVLSQSFLDKGVQHDAAEFAELLLCALNLPSDMFQVYRQATIVCANPDCKYQFGEDDPRQGKHWSESLSKF